jgi:pimeloyl-ACP methyl ester carboxylesterase
MILLLRTAQWLFALFSGLILLMNGCVSFHTPDQKATAYFAKRGVAAQIGYFDFEGRACRYIATGAEHRRKLVLFVHGAPGSSNNFFRFLADTDLRAEARLVAIDRLGYGESGLGQSETDIGVQARQLWQLVHLFPADTVVLVGHSYGGPIVGKYAMDYPAALTAALLLAPVNDPESEPIFWYAHFGRWRATRWLLPAALKVAADEKFSHAAALRAIAEGWASIEVPIVHVHGRKDGLAPLENIGFSRDKIPAEHLRLIYLENTGHFLPWTDYELTKGLLLELLQGEGAALPQK